jgi:hypothetical protein
LDTGLELAVFHQMLSDHRDVLGDLGRSIYMFRKPRQGIGRLTRTSAQLLGGYQAKAAMELMRELPPPTVVKQDKKFQDIVNRMIKRAEDKAKAAFKNKTFPQDATVKWIILIGPYFLIVPFGPFTDTELHTCSPDNGNGAMQMMYDLYLIGTKDAAIAFHHYLESSFHLLHDNTNLHDMEVK